MIPILYHPEFTAGFADREEELYEARDVGLRVYKKAGYYAAELPDELDEDDKVSQVFLARGMDGAVFAAARYVPGREGRPLPMEQGLELVYPAALAAIAVTRRLEGEIVNERPMKSGASALALICSAFLYYSTTRDYDVTVHVTIGRWADRVRKAGFSFHPIPVVRCIYPHDGPMAPYYYKNPEPLSCHYGLIAENRDKAASCCQALGIRVDPAYAPGCA